MKILTKDGKEYDLPPSMSYCEIIKTMFDIEDEGDSEEEDSSAVPLHLVDSKEMEKIIEYCEYHVNGEGPKLQEPDEDNGVYTISKPLESTNIYDIVPEWYAKFVDIPPEDVFRLLLAANYLHVPTLIELCCAKPACDIKGKTPEQIRTTFGLRDDFTEEEKELFRREHAWINDAL